jgi:pimeloyl-ACP methyl ester carboxylesterase
LSPAARLRRGYFDCRYGQLHVHQAIPPGGGFDEAMALVCVPPGRGLGSFFRALLGPLGADRSIYAPDLPGCGESDAAGAGTGPEQFALALADLLDQLHLRRVDVLAQAEGAATALALARLRPGAIVRRMVLSAAPAGALETAGEQGISCREITLAGAGAAALEAGPVDARLDELKAFLAADARLMST